MATLPRSYTPMLMESLQWAFDPLGYADSRFRIMGDVFGTNLPPAPAGQTLVFLNHPDAVQFLLTQDGGDVFSAPGEVNALGKAFFGEHSVLMQSGQAHRRRRKLLMPPFHGERMKAYGDLICQIAQDVMAEWQTGHVFSARSQTQKMTMRVILQAVFGLHEGDRYRRLETLLAERLDVVSSPISSILVFFPQLAADYGPLSPGGYIKRLTDQIDELLYAEIAERRANPDPTRSDVLSLLLSAQDETGEGLSDVELRDELITLLVAGHETTATALAWALYWVHAKPEIKQTLLDELAAHRDADQVTLSRLPYLNAVCNETLRIYPVGILTLGRRVEQHCQVMGYDLKPGDLATGCIYLVHQREDIYPNAREFRPERFLERQFSSYEFFPFGGGSRRCIGSALAMYEMTLILQQVLTSCELELAEYGPVKPIRRGATLAPMGGVKMRKVGSRPAISADTTVLTPASIGV